MVHSVAGSSPEDEKKSAVGEAEERRGSGRPVTVGLVDRIPLVRELLRDLLQSKAAGFEVIAAKDASELLAKELRQGSRPDFIVLRVDRDRLSGPWAARCLEVMRKQLAGVPTILLSDERDPQDVAEALAASLTGYITSTSSAELVESAMHLAANGWILLALGTVPNIGKPPESVARTAAEELAAMSNLTRREKQVLEVLKDGTQNKVIASELNLQESTVKAHVREIMRKLNVRNRTEAAVLYNRLLGVRQGSGA